MLWACFFVGIMLFGFFVVIETFITAFVFCFVSDCADDDDDDAAPGFVDGTAVDASDGDDDDNNGTIFVTL